MILGDIKSDNSTVLAEDKNAKSSNNSSKELDFLNSLITTILKKSEKFSFNEKTKGTQFDSYRLMLRPWDLDLVREIARTFSDFGVTAQLQFKGNNPICIIDCTTVKALNNIDALKIVLTLQNAKTAAGYCGEGELCISNKDLGGALAFFEEAVKLGSKRAVIDVERVKTKITAAAMKQGFGPGLVGIQAQQEGQEVDEQPGAAPSNVIQKL